MKLTTIALAAAFALSSTVALATTKHKSGKTHHATSAQTYKGSMNRYGGSYGGSSNNRGGLVGGADSGTYKP
jgi:hypothetical protein